jgi:DNA-binding MarR family transcriptional regulator
MFVLLFAPRRAAIASALDIDFINFKLVAGQFGGKTHGKRTRVMNKPALWIEAEVDREIASLEQRVDALKQRIAESRIQDSAQRTATEAEVRAVLAARRTREEVIGGELFADPAWDILLYLYAASLTQCRVTVSELTLASAVPQTTGLRWIAKLDDLGLIERSGDPLDGRRIWVTLSDEGETRMNEFFKAIRSGLSLT